MNIYFIRHFKTKGNLEKRYVGSTDEPILRDKELEGITNNLKSVENILSNLISCDKVIDKSIGNNNNSRVIDKEKSYNDRKVIVKAISCAGDKTIDKFMTHDDSTVEEKVSIVYTSPMLRCIQTAKLLFPKFSIEQVEDFRECDFGVFEYLNYNELSGNILYQEWIESNGVLPFPGGESRADFQNRCNRAFVKIISKAIEEKKQNIILVVHGGTIMSILEKYAIPHRDYYDYQIKNGESVHTILFINNKKSQKPSFFLKIE